ncbi:MAG: ParB/RepB/Spo0J family partition protein [Erysipelotrichaceae bacterium]|nr:ParB/RepB/Spo0J family partition protein [Erysipelotrichaceae bacterium]
MKIPIREIRSFRNHPFRTKNDEDMAKLIDSIRENGQIVPIIVRPVKEGKGYEMISGHRRKDVMKLLGHTTIEAEIRDVDNDQATILMVDSNIQREHILPTERGYAYRMRLEAMRHQGKVLPNMLTSARLEPKYRKRRSNEILADQIGVSREQVKRYIRLTYLNKDLQKMVDGVDPDGLHIAFNPACELSFLKKEEQEMLVKVIKEKQATPSLAQAGKLKAISRQGRLRTEEIEELLSQRKPNQKEKLSFEEQEIDRYFPKNYTPRQKKETLLRLLKVWARNREFER